MEVQTRSLWTRSLMAVGLALSLATPVNAWAAQPFGPPFAATATGVGVQVNAGRVGVGVNVGGSHGGYNYGGYGYGYGYGHVRVRAHGRCGFRGGCHKRVRRCGSRRCGGRFVAGVRIRAGGGCGGFRGCGMRSGRRFSLRINIRGGKRGCF